MKHLRKFNEHITEEGQMDINEFPSYSEFESASTNYMNVLNKLANEMINTPNSGYDNIEDARNILFEELGGYGDFDDNIDDF